MAKPDGRSAEAQAWRKWYKTARWQRLRERQLKAHPLCQCPHCRGGRGKTTPATVVDHKVWHKGDKRLFFDPSNVQSMGKDCHDRLKQSQERGGHGFLAGCDEHGWPLAQEHEWHELNAPA